MNKRAMPHFKTPDGMLVDFEVEKLGRNMLPENYEREVFEAYRPSWADMSFDEAVASTDFPRIRSLITWQIWNDMKSIEDAIASGGQPPSDSMSRLKSVARSKGMIAPIMAKIWVRAVCKFGRST
jgi:hypothetical protein